MKELVDGAPKLFLQKFILRDSCLNQSFTEVDIDTANIYKSILHIV